MAYNDEEDYDDEDVEDDDLEEDADEEIDEDALLQEEEAEDEEESEKEIIEEAKAEKEAKDKILQNKLKEIKKRVASSIYPVITFSDRRVMAQAKKKYAKDIIEIEQLAMNKKAVVRQTGSSVGTSMSSVLFKVGIVFVIIIAIAAVFDLMFSWLSQGDGEGMSTQFGVNGEDFYGCRVVYTDEDQAKIDIIRDYAGVVQAAVTLLEDNNANLDITIELPSAEYNYDNFDETTFASEYADLYNVISLMVDDVYSYDQTEGMTESTFEEKIAAIKYFGFDKNLSVTIAETISGYINDNDKYAPIDEDEPIDSSIEQVIVDSINSLLSEEEHNIRTEKVYIKDYIFADSESMMENISKENYIAMIFMPKTDVYFNYYSFILSDIDFDNFNMYISKTNGEIVLTGSVWSTESEVGVDSYMFESSQNLNVSAPVFTNIDTGNLNLLSQGMSIYELLQMEDVDYSIYLETATDDAENQILTWKGGEVIVRFESEQPFYFAEFETDWS